MNQKVDLDNQYLEALKNEVANLYSLSNQLNNDPIFKQEIYNLTQSNKQYSQINITAEHLISQDLVHLYNKCKGLNNNVKGEFTLVYYFEKLKGKSTTKAMNVEKAQQIIQHDNFNPYVKDITSAESKDKSKFIVSSILQKLNSPYLSQYAVCMYRFANFIVKSDGTITPAEELILEEILNNLNNKNSKNNTHLKEIPNDDTLEIVLKELNTLIGLDNIKLAIEEFTNFLKVQKLRKEQGLKTTNNALHSVFMGPPGTGKTTIARLLGRVFKHLGYLEKGHLIETDRAGLVAGYVGQTAIKVDEVIQSAIGGVLFIDEAYSLMGNGLQKDFGNEAIEILLKRMEDNRDKLVVIVAGYPDEMKEFIRSNPGLQSRFNRYYDFNHYQPIELLEIFELFAKNADFKLDKDASDKLMEIFERLYEKRNSSFGNARVVRNLFEKIIELQANRIVKIIPVTEALLTTITEADVPPINKTVEKILMLDKNDSNNL